MIVWVAGYGPSERARRVGPHSPKRGAQRDTLPIVSGCAPGARFIAERSYRGGISDVDPHPARLNLRAQRWPLRTFWLNPALCDSPVLQKGSEKQKKEKQHL